MKSTKKLTMTAMMIALGLVLPPVIRMIPNGGVLFSPMHISPLLTGLVIGPVEGIVVGLICPLLNHLLYGMPQGTTLIGMCFELPVYGLVSGIFMNVLKNQKDQVKVYLSLIIAMLCGRIVGGIVQSIVLGSTYTLQVWIISYFVSTFPAIIIHLILLPVVYFSLNKAGFVKK